MAVAMVNNPEPTFGDRADGGSFASTSDTMSTSSEGNGFSASSEADTAVGARGVAASKSTRVSGARGKLPRDGVPGVDSCESGTTISRSRSRSGTGSARCMINATSSSSDSKAVSVLVCGGFGVVAGVVSASRLFFWANLVANAYAPAEPCD